MSVRLNCHNNNQNNQNSCNSHSHSHNNLPSLLRPLRLRLVLAVVFLVIWPLSHPMVVSADCMVQNHNGTKLSLTALPPGVEYKSDTDTLSCRGANSCREWTITNCNIVMCVQGHACQETQFIDTKSTLCYSYATCQEATFERAHNVNCGMESINTCLQAKMEVSGLVLCIGPNACVSDEDTPMHINVGKTGYILCKDGDFAFSCKHLIVYVNHARRACIVSNEAEMDHCAVVCQGTAECIENTIQFKVLPPPS